MITFTTRGRCETSLPTRPSPSHTCIADLTRCPAIPTWFQNALVVTLGGSEREWRVNYCVGWNMEIDGFWNDHDAGCLPPSRANGYLD